ncbi:MAG: response regulator, partial [Chloroflexi bacterium]
MSEDERRRIARELHDHVEQTFFAIGLTATSALQSTEDELEIAPRLAQALTQVTQLATAGAEQLRTAIFTLSHAEFAEAGLVAALRQLIMTFHTRTGIETDLVLTGQERPIPPDVAEVLHAVSRESLANVERHAHAGAVVLGLHTGPRFIRLTVQDDGTGGSRLMLEHIEPGTRNTRGGSQPRRRFSGASSHPFARAGRGVSRSAVARKIRVLIVDDHELVRAGLRSLLQPEADIEIVGEVATGSQALVQGRRLRPDVVMLDARLPDMPGPDVCRGLCEALPDTAVAILTTFSDDELVRHCVRAGARGYLLKEIPRLDLAASIRA